MANHTSHGALPYPIRGAKFSVQLSFKNSSGVPTDPTSPDTEISTDGGASFTDCTNEVTTGGGNGAGYITLTSSETSNNIVQLAAKSSNCLTTNVAIYPRVLAIASVNTFAATSANGGTLGAPVAYDITNCFILDPENGQARQIASYAINGAFTVSPNWETTPTVGEDCEILLPTGVTLGMLKTLNPTTAGRTLDVASTGEAGLDFANIKQATAPTTLTNITVPTVSALTGHTAQTGDGYAQLIDSTSGLLALLNQIRLRAPAKTWFVKSDGNNSNAGTREAPLQTVQAAHTAAVNGDIIHVIGEITSATAITISKRVILRGDNSATSKIIVTNTTGYTLRVAGNARGAVVEDIAIIDGSAPANPWPSLLFDGWNTVALEIYYCDNVTIRNVLASTTNGVAGIRVDHSRGVHIRNVWASGCTYGIGLWNSCVRSENGRYEGHFAGGYIDSEDVGYDSEDSNWLSIGERFTGTNDTAVRVEGALWEGLGVAGIFYETHADEPRRSRCRFVDAQLYAIATHADMALEVSVVTSDNGANASSFTFENCRVLVVNEGSGPTYHFKASTPYTQMVAINCDHDPTKNSGDVQVINNDLATTGTINGKLNANFQTFYSSNEDDKTLDDVGGEGGGGGIALDDELALGGTVGEALQAALAQGVGKWTLNASTRQMTVFAPDGTTPVATFVIGPNLTTPLTRTPQ